MCHSCNGLGVVYPVRDGEIDYLNVACCTDCETGQARQLEIQRRKFKQTGFPEEYMQFTFNSFLGYDSNLLAAKMVAFYACQLFVDDAMVSLNEALKLAGKPYMTRDSRRNSLVLYGDVGVGKSGLAASAFRELVLKGKTAIYMRVDEVMLELRETWGDRDSSEKAALERFKSVPYLFLDEMQGDDQFPIQPHQKRYMEMLIRARGSKQLPTIITTNMTTISINQSWGRRIGDKLQEMAHWIPMRGQRLRDTAQWGAS